MLTPKQESHPVIGGAVKRHLKKAGRLLTVERAVHMGDAHDQLMQEFLSNEKELKMIWEVVKNHKRSYLVGSAHFFPYRFKTSLQRCLENADTVMFEGPLDPDNMDRVVNRGMDHQSSYHIFDDLDRQSIDRITRELEPQCRGRNSFFILNLRNFKIENLLYEMVRGMKPWLVFFTIWSNYLKKTVGNTRLI